MVGGLWRERELRVRLAELHRYRLAGVTRLEECAHYDQHAAHRRHPAATHVDVRTRLLVLPASLRTLTSIYTVYPRLTTIFNNYEQKTLLKYFYCSKTVLIKIKLID